MLTKFKAKRNLGQNNLETLQNDVFNYNSELQEVILSSNPLICDCRLYGVYNISQHINVFSGTCFSPPSLSNRKLQSLKLHEFCGGCGGLKASGKTTRDGEYGVYLKAKCEGYTRIYCHGMNTDSPQEFISLLSGSQRNYAYIHDYMQPEWNKTECSLIPGGNLYNQSGLTNFTKVRVILGANAVSIKADDFQFATKIGNSVNYGVAGDCYSSTAENCRKGRFQIDLTGTGFRIKDTVHWQHIGSPSEIKNTLDIDAERRSVYAECGGYCGECRPQGTIDLEMDTCTKEGVKPCFRPFGMDDRTIPDSDIRGSSHRPEYLAHYGRLNNIKAPGMGGAWCSGIINEYQYLQVDLGRKMTVSGIATQGAGDQPSWITKYMVQYSDDGRVFKGHEEFGIMKTFTGNRDNFNVATNWLSQRFRGRYIRIEPVEWNNAICLRLEVYGCENDIYSMAVRNQADKRCWTPLTSSDPCSLADATLVVLSPHCTGGGAMFSFADDGAIHHTCSGACIYADDSNFLALRDGPCHSFSKLPQASGAIAIRHVKTGLCVKMDEIGNKKMVLASCKDQTLFELSQEGLSPLRPSISIEKIHYLAVDKPAWIDCKVIADPRAKVFWTKSRPWPNEQGQLSRLEFLEFSNGSLYVRRARMSYTGQYYCTAANSAAFDIGSFEIKVGAPPQFTMTPRNSNATLNRTTQLHCAVASANLRTVITWHMRPVGSSVLTPVDTLDPKRFLVLANMTLMIKNLKKSDEAAYVCTANNPVGTKSSEAFLKIFVPPSFDVLPKDLEVPQGGSPTLQCKGVGDPRPTITWYRKGSKTFPKHFKVRPSGSLYIREITKEDQGTYVCQADNSVGTATAQVIIKVFTACRIDNIPFGSHEPKLQFFRVGSVVQVQCYPGYSTSEGPTTNLTCGDDGEFNESMPKCKDLDECRVSPSSVNDHDVKTYHDCHKHALCINTPGAYRCECADGYRGDGKSCSPICKQPKLPFHGKNWSPRKDEYNLGSSVSLECERGFAAEPPTIKCSGSLSWGKTEAQCKDVDECSDGVLREGKQESACHKDAACQNTVGSYACRCKEGYEGDGYSNCRVEKKRLIKDSQGQEWIFSPNMDSLLTKVKGFEAKNETAIGVLESMRNTTSSEASQMTAGDLVLSIYALKALVEGQEKPRAQIRAEFETAVDVFSNLLKKENKDKWEEVQQRSSGVTEVMQLLDRYASVVATDVPAGEENNTVEIVTDEIVVKVESRRAKTLYDGHTFPPNDHQREEIGAEMIEIPGEVFQDYKSGMQAVHLINVIYSNLGEFLPKRADRAKRFDVDGKVVSSTLRPMPNLHQGKLATPIRIRLSVGQKRSEKKFAVRCVFWDFTKDKSLGGSWSSEGCRLLSSSSNATVCECDHMTSFSAIAVYDKEFVFSLVVYIGCGILLFAVLILILRHLYIHCKRKAERSIIHINLSFAIAAGIALFLGALKLTKIKIACTVVAALLQYFFIAVICWMVVEGFQLYMVLGSGKNRNPARRKWFYLIGWGVPFLVVGISLGVFQLKGYGNAEWCWLDYSDVLMWAHAGPAAAFCLVLLVLVIMIAVAKERIVDSSDKNRVSVLLVFMVLLIVMIPGTWVAAAIYVKHFQDNVIWEYVFAGSCALQGILVLLFGLLDREIKNFSYLYSIKKIQKKEHKQKRNYYSTTDTVQYYGGANAPDGKNYTVTRPSAKSESNTDLKGSSKRLSRIASQQAMDEPDDYPSPVMDTPVTIDNSLRRKIENQPLPYTPSYPNSEVIQLQTFPVRKTNSEARDWRPDGAEEPDRSVYGDHRSTSSARSVSMPRSIDMFSGNAKLQQIPERAPLLHQHHEMTAERPQRREFKPVSPKEDESQEPHEDERSPLDPSRRRTNSSSQGPHEDERFPIDPSRKRTNRSKQRLEERFGKMDRGSISERKRKLRYSSGYIIGATIDTDAETVEKEHASL
ncbi:uncharacterized protein LOC5504243 isoform X2 [Nematostella vectensis]|uniref:uncharacterized protein LOC5504243 isoform X2 n=1 Tax=Nematostella vectensis TaxID=45351 RepID=UPI0020773D75|nr:uncharacterized protein LOC5504243 isoform X2 [Nematostella vectensis]